MKFLHGVLGLALALGASSASAQATATAGSTAKSPRPYRLTYTLTEMDGTKTIGVQHYEVILVEGGRTTLKNGSKIPVATGSYTVAGGAPGSASRWWLIFTTDPSASWRY